MTRQQTRYVKRKYPNERLTRMQSQVEDLRQKGRLSVALMNFSRNPKGQKRIAMPVYSIWPEGKTAKPGRMI